MSKKEKKLFRGKKTVISGSIKKGDELIDFNNMTLTLLIAPESYSNWYDKDHDDVLSKEVTYDTSITKFEFVIDKEDTQELKLGPYNYRIRINDGTTTNRTSLETLQLTK